MSVDKAVFVKDVETYQTLQDASARRKVAKKIFERFCGPEQHDHIPGVSVFEKEDSRSNTGDRPIENHETYTDVTLDDQNMIVSVTGNTTERSNGGGTVDGTGIPTTRNKRNTFLSQNTNVIGVYGRSLIKVQEGLDDQTTVTPPNMFQPVTEEVLNDLRLDVFPRFCRSLFYRMYVRCKSLERESVLIDNFQVLRVLGRGAFGSVNACIKRDTGKVYAMKRINKKRVQATDSVDTIMSERNFLADMDSFFVTGLKYAVMGPETLYLIMDLMVGGDLKFHLNKDELFKEDRSRFYAAEVLLGLEHIHTKKIVYRDLKLENVLLDHGGHCKISDLGLAVRRVNGKNVKGYAGTPGYTAPEVVLNQPYDHRADFFSLGVMTYRFLCGKKPFARKRPDNERNRQSNKKKTQKEKQRRKTSELDKNVVEIEPEYQTQYFSPSAKSFLKGLLCKNPRNRLGANGISEIKQHPWFDDIDFGMLEAGYLDPPFVPRLDEVNAQNPINIGRPPRDIQYDRVAITQEFEKSLKNFPFISTLALQEEIVEVLKLVDYEKAQNGVGTESYLEHEINSRPGEGSCLRNCNIM